MIDKTYNCISCGALNSGSRTECGNCNKQDMKENRLILMEKNVQQIQRVLMVMIQRIEKMEEVMFKEEKDGI